VRQGATVGGRVGERAREGVEGRRSGALEPTMDGGAAPRVRRRRRAGMTFSIDNAYAHVRPPPGLAAPAPPGRALA